MREIMMEMFYNNKDCKKAMKIADKMIEKIKVDKAIHGARENQGYDSIYKFEKKISQFNFSYFDECELKNYFNNLCDKL